MDLDAYYQLVRCLSDNSFQDTLSLRDRRALVRQSTHYIVRDGLLYKKPEKNEKTFPKRVIKTTEIETILFNLHADVTAGHFAFDGTYQRIAARYHWPTMRKDVKDYVNACDVCQRNVGNKKPAPLHPIKIGQPFDRIGIDLVGPLPETKQGNKYIIVATEYLTKWPEAKAIPSKHAEVIAPFIYEEIICRHGCPREILSDQGTEFCNQVVNSMCNLFNVRHVLASAYHPQTNGLVERFNKTLCQSLAKYVQQFEEDWDIFIPSVLFAYRTMQHNTTKHEPFFLTYGRSALLPVEFQLPTYPVDDENIDNLLLRRLFSLIAKLPDALSKAKRLIQKSQQESKTRHDNQLKSITGYHVDDRVWLHDTQRKEKSHSHKLSPKWIGPFQIHTVLQNDAYRLRPLDDVTPLPHTFHSSRLKPYLERVLLQPTVVVGQN